MAESTPRAPRSRQPRRTPAKAVPVPAAPDEALRDDLIRRVAIERVRPEIDAGRFPIKRTPGEPVVVTAAIHADGHDQLAAVLRYRHIPATGSPGEWRETPMTALGNDEWTGRFEVGDLGWAEYTLEGWVDVFATWRKGLAAKVEAGQDVSSELLEGAGLLRAAADRAHAATLLVARADILASDAPMSDRAIAAICWMAIVARSWV